MTIKADIHTNFWRLSCIAVPPHLYREPTVNAVRPTLLCCAALLLAACSPKPTAPPAAAIAAAPQASTEWPVFLKQFQEDSLAANPAFAVSLGRHEFDGRLPDWSAAGIEKEIARLAAARAQAAGFADTALTPEQRFEREYLLAVIDGNLFWLRDVGQPFHNPAFYTGALDPSVYLTRPYAPLEVRLKAFTAYLKAVPAATAQIRENLKLPLPKTFLTLGINSFGGYPGFFRNEVPAIFAAVKDPALQANLKTALEPAAKAMQDVADWLKAEQPKGTDAFALGPEKFAAMLQATERVNTPLAELETIGQADLDRNLASLKAACDSYAPKQSLKACMARESADKAKGGAVEGARAQLAGLRQFILDKNLVTIPGDEQALVAEAPPYQRWNFAYIDIAGPYDKGMPSVYNIAPPDPKWSKKEQADYTPGKNALLFTSAHEVWPGHFLQFLHANRSPFEFGRLFVGYAFAEGWAHYTEEMMWDAGLGNGAPETHIGQLQEALLRNVRFVCAIGMHTQGMTVAQCEQLFRDKGMQDAGNARQQAARGTYDPAYLNYTMGKLMIRKLAADWQAAHPGLDSLKAFHDQFLSYGGPPIPLVRAQMMGTAGALF
jgi:Bacterial protein of unknown function (DUF885)